jgi:hypothetical protein
MLVFIFGIHWFCGVNLKHSTYILLSMRGALMSIPALHNGVCVGLAIIPFVVPLRAAIRCGGWAGDSGRG